MSFIVNYVYANCIEYNGIISSMSVGMYTGGTPNFNAIGKIFFLDSSVTAVANLSDTIIEAILYLFLLTLAKLIFKLSLKPSEDHYQKETIEISNTDDYDTVYFKWSKDLLKAIGISFLGVLGSAVFGILVVWIIFGMENGRMNDFLVTIMLLGVTIYGIIISLATKLYEVKFTNITAQCAILVFLFTLASSLDLTQVGGAIMLILTTTTIGKALLHLIFSFILKSDVDCAIVALIAGIYGPTFVPAITKKSKIKF
jgi:uncharacterized membrane protein